MAWRLALGGRNQRWPAMFQFLTPSQRFTPFVLTCRLPSFFRILELAHLGDELSVSQFFLTDQIQRWLEISTRVSKSSFHCRLLLPQRPAEDQIWNVPVCLELKTHESLGHDHLFVPRIQGYWLLGLRLPLRKRSYILMSFTSLFPAEDLNSE